MLATDTCRIITAQFRRSYSGESATLTLHTTAGILGRILLALVLDARLLTDAGPEF